MKKKYFYCLFAMLLVSISTYAGKITVKSGDLSIIKNSAIKATIKFDYTDLILEGKPYMEHLKSKGEDFVRDWPTESTTSEAYFIKCWNKDNDEGMQLTTAANNEYLMYFHVKKMHMGSGAASMLVGFGAGGASMTATMYIFKNNNSIPILTVEIDDQTGRSGMTEIIRRTDLYGELAEDLVDALEKTKQSKVKASTVPVKVPNLKFNNDEITSNVDVNEIQTTEKSVSNISNVNSSKNSQVKETDNKQKITTRESLAFENSKNVPLSVINATSNLTLNKKGEAGTVEEIINEKRIAIYIDYSEAIINNKSIDDFIEYMTTSVREKERDPEFKNNWENNYRQKFTLSFIDKANDELADEDQIIRLTTNFDCKYTLKVSVIEFDEDGNNTCDYLIVKTETGEVIAHYRLEADGGKVGKYIGLLEQGHSSAGQTFGELLAKKIDKIKD